MLENIPVGSSIKITVTKQPTNEAARKTLVRVLLKDQEHQAEVQRRRGVRKSGFDPQPRGGRLYGGHVKITAKPVRALPGEHGTVRATQDVINDLRKLDRFVEVSQA